MDISKEEKYSDPFFGALVEVDGFGGQVEDIEFAMKSKMKLYRVRYDDMDREHLTHEEVLQYRTQAGSRIPLQGAAKAKAEGIAEAGALAPL